MLLLCHGMHHAAIISTSVRLSRSHYTLVRLGKRSRMELVLSYHQLLHSPYTRGTERSGYEEVRL